MEELTKQTQTRNDKMQLMMEQIKGPTRAAKKENRSAKE